MRSGFASGAASSDEDRDHVREHGIGRCHTQLGERARARSGRHARLARAPNVRSARSPAGRGGARRGAEHGEPLAPRASARRRSTVWRAPGDRRRRLRDDDEPHVSAPLRRASRRRAQRSSPASARASMPVRIRASRGRAEPLGELAIGEDARSAATSASVSAGGTSSPSTPSVDEVGDAAARSRRRPSAGEGLDDDAAEPSGHDGSTSTVASSSTPAPPRAASSGVVLDPVREVARRAGRPRPARAAADDRRAWPPVARDAPPCGGQPVDVLVPLEHADAGAAAAPAAAQARREAARSLYVGKPRVGGAPRAASTRPA